MRFLWPSVAPSPGHEVDSGGKGGGHRHVLVVGSATLSKAGAVGVDAFVSSGDCVHAFVSSGDCVHASTFSFRMTTGGGGGRH